MADSYSIEVEALSKTYRDGALGRRRQRSGGASGTVVVARADADWLLEDGGLLKTTLANLSQTTYSVTSKDSPPRYIIASADGAWTAVVEHKGNLRVSGPTDEVSFKPRIPEQGNVSAAVFTEDGRLWVAGKYRRISVYDPDSFETLERFRPELKPLESVARYALNPLYTIFPKPGELDSVITYLMSEETSVASGQDDLGARRAEVKIWSPLLSNLAFLTVVLSLACAYIHRKDF